MRIAGQEIVLLTPSVSGGEPVRTLVIAPVGFNWLRFPETLTVDGNRHVYLGTQDGTPHYRLGEENGKRL